MTLFAVADIKGFAMGLQIFYGVSPVHAALIVGLAVSVYVTLGGLAAVIATDVIQFLCLGFFILIMAFTVLSGATEASALPTVELFTSMPDSWWNPLSIGMPRVLIFVFAIVPGWISEQDPWQRVWAAKDELSARNGMFFGALLVALVFRLLRRHCGRAKYYLSGNSSNGISHGNGKGRTGTFEFYHGKRFL
jgi:solute:Na+ symporter, SSS family